MQNYYLFFLIIEVNHNLCTFEPEHAKYVAYFPFLVLLQSTQQEYTCHIPSSMPNIKESLKKRLQFHGLLNLTSLCSLHSSWIDWTLCKIKCAEFAKNLLLGSISEPLLAKAASHSLDGLATTKASFKNAKTTTDVSLIRRIALLARLVDCENA